MYKYSVPYVWICLILLYLEYKILKYFYYFFIFKFKKKIYSQINILVKFRYFIKVRKKFFFWFKMGGVAKEKMIDFPIMKQVRKNYSLFPIVVVVGFGCALSAFAIVRTLTRSPDVSINRRGNPKPYEYLETKDGNAVRYKYFSTLDYNKFKSERPRLD